MDFSFSIFKICSAVNFGPFSSQGGIVSQETQSLGSYGSVLSFFSLWGKKGEVAQIRTLSCTRYVMHRLIGTVLLLDKGKAFFFHFTCFYIFYFAFARKRKFSLSCHFFSLFFLSRFALAKR